MNIDNSIESEGKENKRKIDLNAKDLIEVEFFLTVQQVNYLKADNNCLMCLYDLLPMTDSNCICEDHLISYEMWLMCDIAGYKSEDFQPNKGRTKIEYLPHSIEIMKNNAPYLAYKFNKLIIKKDFKKNSDLILLFPDETTNELELVKRDNTLILLSETPSGYFAESLKQLEDFQYFSIPRNIIRKLQEKEIMLNDIPSQNSDFYNNLKKLPEAIIIFDEFKNSGGTFSIILKILESVNKKPIAFFPIFDYFPSDKQLNNIPVLSLYKFDITPEGNNAK
ncbi:hypothetical protein HY745_06875 [Candidatus Desantisbacteria bacterium]|nr:hypothetical protein [Candidatus Desantisbacteria bacterium]